MPNGVAASRRCPARFAVAGALVGLDRADDAAVYQISDERAIVATIDVITPIVDDPTLFGAIAAANAFSDVFMRVLGR